MEKFDHSVPPPARFSNFGPNPKYPFHLINEGESVWMDPADYGQTDIINIRVAAHTHAKRYALRFNTREERMEVNGVLIRGIRVWNLGMNPDVKRDREAADRRSRIADWRQFVMRHGKDEAQREEARTMTDDEVWAAIWSVKPGALEKKTPPG